MLNTRQRKFVHDYVRNGFSKADAVISAGFTQNRYSAYVIGYRLLQKVTIQREIEKHMEKVKLSADQVLEELSEIAVTKAPVDGAQRLKALELLGKGHKLFVDRVEQTTSDSTVATSLSQSILSIATKDNLQPDSAAISLFDALKDDANFSDVNSWPEEYRAAITAHIAQTQLAQSVTEVDGEQ